MSDALFPELPGLEWESSKTPIFNTKIMTSVNGRELRASYQAVPKYKISLSYSFLRESKDKNELQQLEGFFLERRGSFDSFLLKMPEDNEFKCTFIGDGEVVKYQIYKQLHTVQMPIVHTKSVNQAINPDMWNRTTAKPMWDSDTDKPMWNNGTASLNKNGELTLSIPLEDGVSMNMIGTFYYRCRFADDEQQYTNFMSKLWKANKVEMIGSLGNKI